MSRTKGNFPKYRIQAISRRQSRQLSDTLPEREARANCRNVKSAMFYAQNYLPLSIKSRNNWCQLKFPSSSPTLVIVWHERAIWMNNAPEESAFIGFYLTLNIIIWTGCLQSRHGRTITADLFLNYRCARKLCHRPCRDAAILTTSWHNAELAAVRSSKRC